MNATLVVYEDKYGYIWLGSQSGVDRFDGYDFKNFANVSSDSTSTNLPQQVLFNILPLY